ncbi:hypothetical protein JCM18902_342 [Psychrobacter sp. JCM 18902]|nr:hypothetical protein JCM18902_342 [Psychrobacter sp. JCM 18902]
MTEPTAKPRAGANSQQGSAVSAKKQSDMNPSNVKHGRKDKAGATPDKAMLLALFTLPDIEEVGVKEVVKEVVKGAADELSNTHSRCNSLLLAR